MHEHGRPKKLANAPNGYQCGFPKSDGAFCTELFTTKKKLQDHKKKENHVRAPKNKKPSGRKKKKA